MQINRVIPVFVATRRVGAIRDDALPLYAEGIASVQDIDTAAKTALGHPMGWFIGVQSNRTMGTINMLGSVEQKLRWLPRMAALELIGAFALTEPEHDSGSAHLEATARRVGNHWVLNGRKRWIGTPASPTSSSSGPGTRRMARSKPS